LQSQPPSTSPSQVATDSQGVPSSGNDVITVSALGTQGVEKKLSAEVPKNLSSSGNEEGQQQDNQSDTRKRKRSLTTEAKTGVSSGVKKQRALGFEYFSKTIAKIVPKVIDLTNSGEEDDDIEEKITGLKEFEKNKCLRVFFKYLRSNRTKLAEKMPPVKEQKKQHQNDTNHNDEVCREEENIPSDEAREDSSEDKKVQKKQKRHQCPYIDYEAHCEDKTASSDEHTDDTGDNSQAMKEFINDEILEKEDYIANHRLLGSNVSSEETRTPVNRGPNTLSRGKQLQLSGKRFNPPTAASRRGGVKGLRLQQSDFDSVSSRENELDDGDASYNQSHAEEGKTPEGEEEEEEEEEEENKEDADKANDTNTSSDGEPSESTGKADDVVPDSADNIGADSHGEDFIHDQNVNFDLGNLGGEDDLLQSSNNVDEEYFGNQNVFGSLTTIFPENSVQDFSVDSKIGDSSLGDPFLDSDVADSPVPRRTSARKKPSKR
jgi:hypothetical protein